MIKSMFNKIFINGVVILLFLSSTYASTMGVTSYNKELKNAKNLSISDTDILKKQGNWTVMMYLAFDNQQTEDIDYALNILTNIGSSSNFNIIALVDGNNPGDTNYYFIGKNNSEELSWNENESNMAYPDVLKNFLDSTIQKFPANHYALFIIGSHGSGWQGIGSDMQGSKNLKNMSILQIPDYSEILYEITGKIGKKIDIIGFDICVTGSIEVAYQIAPYVHYMIANEEHTFYGKDEGKDQISEEGNPLEWNYSCFLQNLKDNPYMDSEDFAISVVDCFQPGTHISELDFFKRFEPRCWFPKLVLKTDLSAINLSQIDELIASIDKLSEILMDNLSECKNEIHNALLDVREYGKGYRRFWWLLPFKLPLLGDSFGYDCFIDLYDFVEKLNGKTIIEEIKGACNIVMNAMNSTIIANKKIPDDFSHGLHIYFPKLKCQYDVSIWKHFGNPRYNTLPITYGDLRFSKDTAWDNFIRAYLKI